MYVPIPNTCNIISRRITMRDRDFECQNRIDHVFATTRGPTRFSKNVFKNRFRKIRIQLNCFKWFLSLPTRRLRAGLLQRHKCRRHLMPNIIAERLLKADRLRTTIQMPKTFDAKEQFGLSADTGHLCPCKFRRHLGSNITMNRTG